MIVKMIKNLENKMEKMHESINKDLVQLKNKHTETNNTITEIKNTLEGINSRIPETEEQTSELEDKMVKITSEEQNKVIVLFVSVCLFFNSSRSVLIDSCIFSIFKVFGHIYYHYSEFFFR